MADFQFRAMNTDILLAAEGNQEDISEGFKAAAQLIRSEELRFTRFSNDSELSGLNRSGGAWYHVSPEMMEVLQLALYFKEQTHGLFDPMILRDLERVGYDRSFEYIKSGIGIYPKILIPHQPIDLDEILINSEQSLVSLPPGLTIDLGGIAKGWIVAQAAKILAEYSNSCGVSAGGDIVLIGLPAGESRWQVALEDPRNPGEALVILNLTAGAVATSSIAKRTWKQADKIRHHLIDPRTGEPAVTEWQSVTVIADDICVCEAYAKALLIAGPSTAREMAEIAGINFLAVGHDGSIIGTKKSLGYIHE